MENINNVNNVNNRPKRPTNHLLMTIDRWGPGVIALLTLLAVILVGWTGSSRTSRLEGLVIAQDKTLSRLDDDVRSYQAYVILLQRKLIEHGIDVPTPPQK